ncbi:MAG: RNA-binding S4 domain-containing protein [Rhodovibrionaceae bacterium]
MTDEAFLRADKWLYQARFFKSRSLASKVCDGGLRISGNKVDKAHARVRVGDVLTFPQGLHIRVVKVLALGTRRGPASEAQGLYEDLSPPEKQTPLPKAARSGVMTRDAGSGRPTKRDRRQLDRLRRG